MKGKTKLAGKALSLLLSLIMILTAASFNLGFSAFATEEQEVNFCVDKMKNLPTDDEFLKEMLKTLPEDNPNKSQEKGDVEAQQENGENTTQEKKEKFNTKRSETIVHSDGKTEEVKFNEEEVYKEIQNLVNDLTQKFQGGQAAESVLNFQKQIAQTDESKTSHDHSRNLQKADAIYRWVAKNIRYDHESYDAIRKLYDKSVKTQAKWKPQDAYFVFHKKTGVCEGYARLTNLMMRMAGVPCMYVGSINGPDKNYGHAFNAIYVEDEGRKGWTLLDSCWASPSGSDGDEEIKKFLSGENFPNDCSIYDESSPYSLKNILLREDEGDKYLHEVFDKIFKYLKNNDPTNPSQELVDALNKQVSDTLKQANENHKDGTHLKKIEFFIQTYNSGVQELRFKYETDQTAQQAKQANDRYKELQASYSLKNSTDILTGKIYSGVAYVPDKDLADLTKDDLEAMLYIQSFTPLNEIQNFDDNAARYNEAFQQILLDVMFSRLDYIKKQIGDMNSESNNQLKALENVNSELNSELEKLNEKYSNTITFKQVELSLNKAVDGGCTIDGKFDTGLSEEEIKKLYSEQGLKKEENTQESNFEEFFPAFYNKNQSLDDANRKIIEHTFHKISSFEVNSLYEKKINFPSLRGNEGKAFLSLLSYAILAEKIKTMIVSDDSIKLDDRDPIKVNLSLPISVSDLENLEINGNVSVRSMHNVQNLKIEDDATIDLNEAYGLKNIDTTNSKKYYAENGILYHTENNKPGTKGEKIGEIYKSFGGFG